MGLHRFGLPVPGRPPRLLHWQLGIATRDPVPRLFTRGIYGILLPTKSGNETAPDTVRRDNGRITQMERPIFQPVGTPVEELDTPALVVDLEVMDRNIQTFQSYFKDTSVKARPVVTSHLCPQVARRQLDAGGTNGGIAVTTLGEAEVFAAAGFIDILLANLVVTRAKINRLCALAGQTSVGVAVDSPDNAEQLSQGAAAAGVELRVLVEIEAGMGRCGIAPGPDAVSLAQKVNNLPGLKFQGIMGSVPGPRGEDDPDQHRAKTTANLQVVLDAKEQIEQAGLPVETVSVGGTHCYAQAVGMAGVTEVRAGRYPLMDHRLKSFLPDLEPAAKVLASVISHPMEDMAVLDAGHKAMAPDQGRPILEGVPGGTASRFSAEHGVMELEGDARNKLNPGDKAWLVPYELGACVNQFDYIRATKDGKLEGFWPISARGKLA
ncbi:MAG TPA: alanine racemase [Dehalococcoidia bacterium]|nr:alanine racemase [Chloroflexota bacterium]HCL26717.1 alanine racemase [Dehalococcoidia bacterium]